MKIAVVVVTYNRLHWLRKNLDALFNQTRIPDRIIVVDNASSDGTADYLNKISGTHENLSVLRLKENLGGSGGFSEGLKYAVNRGADWIWMMDDDALPYSDALSNLADGIKNVDENVGVLLSHITSRKNPKKMNTFTYAISGTFVGFAVRSSVVERVGFPDSGFFIYADDYDYSIRIRKAGFKIIKVNTSLIYHKDWAKQKKIFKFPFIKPQIPSWKTYYIVRNTLNASRHFKIFYIAVWLYFFFDRFVWSYVNPSTKRYVFKGFKDGVNGVKGKKVLPDNF